jgi:hypothetical protein
MALFGVRITNANVTAVVQGAPKPSDGPVKLESMALLSYGTAVLRTILIARFMSDRARSPNWT